MGRDGEHIWLRQSATFTVNGETRTVEIGVPLHPGATPEEVEALLREADSGMERLSRHLDARVAALRGEALSFSAVPAEATAHPQPLAAPVRPTLAPPTPQTSEPQPASDSSARHAAPPPSEPLAEPQVEEPTNPAAVIAALRERGGLSLVRDMPAPSQPAPSQPAPPRSVPSEPAPRLETPPVSSAPLTLPEFLKTAQDEFGYTPKTVMEKLGVRSLSGVNYREAIETLRRQALRDGTVTPPPNASARDGESEPPRRPAVPQTPRYFEEELDEPEIHFGGEDDEDGALPGGFGLDDDDEILDELELEEEIAPPPPTRSATTARTRPTAQSQAPASAPTPSAPLDPVEAERARIAELLAQLRSPKAGGVPSSHQRTAFRNIVVQELGDEKTKALVAGLYRVTAERIGPEQIDALLSWGKRDTFADDADVVLAALRAERAAQQASQSTQAGAEQATPRASRAPRA